MGDDDGDGDDEAKDERETTTTPGISSRGVGSALIASLTQPFSLLIRYAGRSASTALVSGSACIHEAKKKKILPAN